MQVAANTSQGKLDQKRQCSAGETRWQRDALSPLGEHKIPEPVEASASAFELASIVQDDDNASPYGCLHNGRCRM